MTRIWLVALLVACSDVDSNGGTPDAAPKCAAADECQVAKYYADRLCGQRYRCDPTYSEDLPTCFAAEMSALCASGDAAIICGLKQAQRMEFEMCVDRVPAPACGEPFGCIP